MGWGVNILSADPRWSDPSKTRMTEKQFYSGHYFTDVPAGVYLMQIRWTGVSESRKIVVK